MEQIKAYYAVIPANVRYDTSLPAGAKLLYGEITALCNQEGFCWAENSYFAELYSVGIRTVQLWINALLEKKYIYRNFQYKKDGKTIINRCLSIVEKVPSDFMGECKKFHGEHEKNYMVGMKNFSPIILQVNNTDEYNTLNKSVDTPMKSQRGVKPTLEEVQAYCKERGNTVDAQRFIDYYTSNGWKVGRNSMKDWKAAVRTWERDRNTVSVRQNKTAAPSKYDREE